ncbi:hypothetical protein LTS18_014191 [Coniosporium uncinatum]|uniref:Uncharacterized protein n=1 Tax=Coniosporium uncinatum TaxID=93489 RepID=A0ACC3DCV9_9PEZI|nr:hypothetical protein LTS18_014191 [Coniosporium uncinatum]
MTGSEVDLRHAISMRPHPFHIHPRHSDSFRSDSPRPENIPIPGTPDHISTASHGKPAARSTAFEAATPPDEVHDPVARHAHDAAEGPDVERQSLPAYTRDNDPFQLSSKIKSAAEIDNIKANTSRKRENVTFAPIAKSKDAWKARKLQGFYEAQNENIERLLKPVDDHIREAKEQDGENHLKFKIAVHGSFVANVILAGLQLYGAASSGSLSIFTTMADALFDPLSNVTLILCNRAVNRVDPRKFPSGKARIETAGNIAFCFLMCAVSFIIIVMSIRELAAGNDGELTYSFHLPSVIAVAIAFMTKFALFLYCWSLRNVYSQIRILWEDHRNDLLINGFGVMTSVGGSKLRWWIDPMGAIILSVLIAALWLRTAWSEFQLLIGVTADTHMLQLITYISMTHSPMIQSLDTVRAYHSGPRLIVEVDIVMDPDETLRATHDVAEELQTKLESLPNVERAYVHVDFETSHSPEHFYKKEL